MQLLEVISPYEKCRMGIKNKGEIIGMEELIKEIFMLIGANTTGMFISYLIIKAIERRRV